MTGRRTRVRVLTALLGAAALAAVRSRARSLAASWCRPEPRHARPPAPPSPLPWIAGMGKLPVPLDVVRVPFPDSMPYRPADASATTLVDELPLVRPYVASGHRRPGRWAA